MIADMLVLFFLVAILRGFFEMLGEPPRYSPPRKRARKTKRQPRAIRVINQTVDEYANVRRNFRQLERKYPDLMDDPEFAEVVVNIHAHYRGRKLDLLLRELHNLDHQLPPGDIE